MLDVLSVDAEWPESLCGKVLVAFRAREESVAGDDCTRGYI